MKNKKSIFTYDDHKLVSRRDFLASGAIPFAAYLTAPTLFELLASSTAYACDATQMASNPDLPSFVQLNLAGGAGLAANFVPRGKDGLIVPNLNLMGLGSRSVLEAPRDPANVALGNRLETELGVNQGFLFSSGLLAGLRATASQAVRDNTAIIGVMVRSNDDSNQNRLSGLGLVNKAGLVGSVLPILNNGAGMRQMPATIDPPAALGVNSLTDIQGAVGVQGPLGKLGTTKLGALFSLIKNLSESQAQALASKNATEVQSLISCATGKNADAAGATPPGVDPRVNSALSTIWNINANTGASSRDLIFAAIVYNSLIRQTGSAALELGGYDYHNNTRTSGDTQDNLAGQTIGRILSSAAALGKPIYLWVTTDGSVRSADSLTDPAAPWVSDRGQAGLNLVFAYSPTARPVLTDKAGIHPNQIGYLTTGQAADDTYINNWNPERATLSIFANYLGFAYGNQLVNGVPKYQSLLDQVVGATARKALLSDADLAKIMRTAA